MELAESLKTTESDAARKQIDAFEKDGIDNVKIKIAQGNIYGAKKRCLAETWIKDQEAEIAQKNQDAQADREERMINEAVEANKIARAAKRTSWWAIAIALLAAFIAAWPHIEAIK